MTAPTTFPTAEWRPRSLHEADAVLMDNEVVVYSDGQVHVLNPTAALVWQNCDGRVSLGALADELAASFHMSSATVLADVLNIVASLLDNGLVVESASAENQPIVPATKPVLEPAAVCSGCGSGPDFEVHVLVDVGKAAVSIGADSEVATALERALGPRAIGRVDVASGRASYGVVLPRLVDGRGPQPVARLHRGPDVLFRSRDPERVLRALVAQVSTHDNPTHRLMLDAIAVGRAGAAVLVPIPQNRVAYARAAAAAGLQVSDAPNTLVGRDPSGVVVGATWADLDGAPLRQVAGDRMPRGREPSPLPWGDYRLAAIGVLGPGNAMSVLAEVGPSLAAECDPARQFDALQSLLGGVAIIASHDFAAIAGALELTRD